MLFNLLTRLLALLGRLRASTQADEPFDTLTGEHFLGEAQNLPGRYSTGRRPRWVKFVGDVGLTLNSAPHLPPGTNIIHRFYAKPPFISDNIGAWIGSDNPATSARRWVNHFKDELNALKSIPGRRIAIDGPGNEAGQGELYAKFCFELAKILYREFDEMLLAAFGASTGSYNEAQALTAQGLPDRNLIRQQIIRNARILSESHDPLAAQSLQSEVVEILRLEAQSARAIADTYVIPLIKEGIPVYLSLHAYASLYPMVWHGDHRQKPQIQQIWNSGARGDIFGLNDFMPTSVLDDPGGSPSTYTGFGWIRLLWHFKHNHQIDLKKIGLLITEGGIVDNVGDPGIGTTAAGCWQWVERGLWDKLRVGNDSYEMVAARGLLYIEQQCRIFLPLLLDMATTPFTDTDLNKGTRWHIEYRTIEVMPLFNQLARMLPPLLKPPPPAGCQISPSGNLTINIRQQPTTDAPITGELAPGQSTEALATIRDVDNQLWYRVTAGFIASFAAVSVTGADCNTLPDETPDPEEPPDNGEEPTVSNLLGFKIENKPTIEQLRPMMDGLEPAYCTVVVEVGDAAYVASLAEAFPNTTFGVLFNFSLDFGELVHEKPATPTDFAPLYEAATTREAGQVNFNANTAWLRWRDGTSANQNKLIADFQHFATLPADVRRRILIMSFFELPIDDVLTPAYIAFEKERMIQMAFDYGLGAIILNHRGQHQGEAYFALLGSMGVHLAMKTTNDQLGHQQSSIGRTDDAGLLFELLHGPENQAGMTDGHLTRHPKEMINQTPVYEAGDFSDIGGHPSSLALKILPDHHRLNHHVPMPSVAGGIRVRITNFGYRGDSGEHNYRHYHTQGKPLDGYHDNAPVWAEWGLDPVETLKKQLAYAPAQIAKVPQVAGIALDNVFGGGPRDVSGVAFFEDEEPEPEPEAPVAVIAAPLSAKVGEAVSFDGINSTGDIQAYEWNFGDGATRPGVIVTHAFLSAGFYPVKLTVTSPTGKFHEATHVITVTAVTDPDPPAPTSVKFSGRILGIIPFTGVVEMVCE